MKTLRNVTVILHTFLVVLSASAAVPLRWTVETSRLQPVAFDAVRGETMELEASFKSYGKPIATSNQTAFICWQTNGMGSAWWTTNAFTTATVARVLFTPQMDPGAPVVHGFIGLSSTTNQLPTTIYQLPTTSYQLPTTSYQLPSLSYRAAFTLRFRHGPGETPNALPLPTPTIDCQKVTFLHPESAPFSGGGGGGGGVTTQQATNIAQKVIREDVRTNYLCTVETAQTMADGAEESAKVQSLSIEGGEVRGNITYGSVTFGKVSDGIDGLKVGESYFGTDGLYFPGTIWIPQETSGSTKPLLIGDWYIGSFIVAENKIAKIGDISSTSVTNLGAVAAATNVAFAQAKSYTDAQFTTNNTALVSVVTNLAPAKARGISLSDPVRHCNWYQVVTNGVFFWLVEE